MVSLKDCVCLNFGRRLRDDAKGPTHASAIDGMVPASFETGALSATVRFNLSGGATYKRTAAGKFAINDSLGSDGDASNFTADALLIAKTGATTNVNSIGLIGTVEENRLNDGSEEPGLSVSPKMARGKGTDNADELMANTGTNTADDSAIDDTAIDGTADEWSISGTATSGQTGRWEALLFDEKGDGGNVPTTAAGMFRTGFGQPLAHLSRKPVGGTTLGPPMPSIIGFSDPPTRTTANGWNGRI